jgi:hypothetical protein
MPENLSPVYILYPVVEFKEKDPRTLGVSIARNDNEVVAFL